MDPPLIDGEVKPSDFEEARALGHHLCCSLFDTEMVHKIAQLLIPGLASACVDNITGDLFRGPGSVAVDIRKEMVEYLTQRSKTFVAETVVLEGGLETEKSDGPYDIISDFIEDFSSLKRNIFSRVSGWLLSESREDRIDDFVQEMEMNGFWKLERREILAQALLKNLDFRNTFHCDMKFDSEDELKKHSLECSFRSMSCTNEGCNSVFSAFHSEDHDSICPFKLLACEQKCSSVIMRRDMDKHCITVCPMKLVNCPFYQVGCEWALPLCKINEHRLEHVRTHLLHILRVVHKDLHAEDLENRAKQIEKLASPGQLPEARDVRTLTYVVKNLESSLGPLIKTNTELTPEPHTESTDKEEAPAREKKGAGDDSAN